MENFNTDSEFMSCSNCFPFGNNDFSISKTFDEKKSDYFILIINGMKWMTCTLP